jgi:hypothetical protein
MLALVTFVLDGAHHAGQRSRAHASICGETSMVAAANESSPKSYSYTSQPTPFVSSNWLLQPYVWIEGDVPQVQVVLAGF